MPVAENESLATLEAEGAVYRGDYNYLPGHLIKNLKGRAEKLQMADIRCDTLTSLEKRIFRRMYDRSFVPLQCRTYNRNGEVYSDVLIFPFYYDSLSGNFLKITSFKLLYETKPEIQRVRTTAQRTAETSSSVLASGDWHKIAVTKNGVYKIDRDFLRSLGVDESKVDPRKIKLYGNGGGLLPQENSEARPEDLVENAITVHGETDGSFDANDFILFYGQNTHKISLDPETGEVAYNNNFYSDTTYYFLTTTGANGKRITQQANSGNSHPRIDTYNDLQFHEDNRINLIKSGRNWYGERFDASTSRDFKFDLAGAVAGTVLRLGVAAVAQSFSSSEMDVSINGTNVGALPFSAIPDDRYSIKGFESSDTFLYTVKSGENAAFTITLRYAGAPGARSTAYLNYLTLTCERSLELHGPQLVFRSLKSTLNSVSSFSISNATGGHLIWDVSDPQNTRRQEYSLSSGVATFGTTSEELKEFVIFHPSTAMLPAAVGPVANQNLRGKPVPDLVIVSAREFLDEAIRLAAHRESADGLDVLVATPAQVYNEFSSGAQDATAIRDMMRYFYQKGDQTKPKNLLLMGKCSYDYKNRLAGNTNFVPTYPSRNSLHPLESYSSDDYFAFLEEEEGEWRESFTGDHTMDIGVGRLPVKTAEEARTVVDKLIHYDTHSGGFGEWRNRIFFIADDGDANIHMRDAERLSILVDTTYSRFNASKIYIDAYPQIKTASRQTAPEVNAAINRAIDKGGLIFNFTGHGSEEQLCDENIMNIGMITKWENRDRLPLFVTATCEFGKHDDPTIISAAEEMLLSVQGGAIGLVTTARPVYSNTNYEANLAFYNSVFEQDDQGYRNLGVIFKNTKNLSLSGVNNRNFSLLGDPSMILAYSENNVEITAGFENARSPGDTLRALELIRMSGRVTDILGNDISGFDGAMTATVFDKPASRKTLGDENPPFTYSERNSTLFRGDVSIQGGAFSFQFVVPKNIKYPVDYGKVSLYAQSANLNTDAAGAEMRFLVGETGAFVPDRHPPVIDLYVNDTTFRNGDFTAENLVALAGIYDENGISILNHAVNQGVIISLDGGDFEYAGEFFKNETDSYRKGWLRYPYFELEEGPHTITVGAWDTHNNYSEQAIELYVVDGEKFVAENLFNYPNPFRHETTFTFEHNRAGDDLEIQLNIFDMNGREVFSGTHVTYYSAGRIDGIRWRGNATNGKKLEPGIYVYTITVRSLKDASNIRLSNKLLIIN